MAIHQQWLQTGDWHDKVIGVSLGFDKCLYQTIHILGTKEEVFIHI